VGPEACCVTFGWVPTYRHSIRLDDVVGVEIVAYRAIREHGFWGIRTMPSGERVLTARGNQAVRVFLRDGRCVLIGTQRPEELARALGSRCA
jgi:hypothetical protein